MSSWSSIASQDTSSLGCDKGASAATGSPHHGAQVDATQVSARAELAASHTSRAAVEHWIALLIGLRHHDTSGTLQRLAVARRDRGSRPGRPPEHQIELLSERAFA
jgi:hypothetical protein